MKKAIAILKIQRSRIRRLVGETNDPDLRHEFLMLLNETTGALWHMGYRPPHYATDCLLKPESMLKAVCRR